MSDSKEESGATGEKSGADSQSLAQARTTLTVEQRVDHCAALMADLQWVRGKTAKLLAAEWGLSVSAVENYSAEASRRVIGDRDEAIRDITAGARKLFGQCVQDGDAKGAKAIGELWADVAGAKAPTKQEIDAKVSNGASPEEAARLVREKFGEHAATGGTNASLPGSSGK